MAIVSLVFLLGVGVALWLCMMHIVWARMLYPLNHRYWPLNMWAVPPLALLWALTGLALGIALLQGQALFDKTWIARSFGRLDWADCCRLAFGAIVCATVLTIWLKRRRVLRGGLEVLPRRIRCGYVLRGLNLKPTEWSVRCPECGKSSHTSAIARQYRRELFARRVLLSATQLYVRYDRIKKEVREAPSPFDEERSTEDEPR